MSRGAANDRGEGGAAGGEGNATADSGRLGGEGFTGDRPLALITGAAKRVGRAISRELARAGCDVLLTYRTSDDEAADAVAEFGSLGVGAAAERLDLADVDAVEAFGERVVRQLPRLDVLVHNASAYGPKPLSRTTAADAERYMRIHATAPLLLTKRLVPLLRTSELPGGGVVIAMLDAHTEKGLAQPRPGFAAYSMSKAALGAMVRSLAVELAAHVPRSPASPNDPTDAPGVVIEDARGGGVRVNGVAPGVVAFPASGYESTQAEQRAYLERVPMGRPGEPEDAARTVRALVFELTYLTGHVLPVDGGRSLA